MHLIIGTGKVGLPLSQLFHASNIPALSTTRSGKVPSPLKGVAFDWSDPSTFDNAFSYAEAASDVIQIIFMTPPPSIDMLDSMKPFIDFAAKIKDVKRFILISATLVGPRNFAHGAVHQYLLGLGVDYVSIRPSWFFQNFYPNPGFVFYSDLVNGTITSSTGSFKVGFVDARDIAEAAFQAMTEKVPLNGSYIVLGPELLTYTDVAKIISSVTGRTIIHRNLTRSEFKEHAMRVMSEPHAEVITMFEDLARTDTEERFFLDGVSGDAEEKEEVWKGKRTIQNYFEEIKGAWME
ncbi:NAD(P)-binding protein [Gymnopus androsaceus JB14]|uniref:NAD(P)-binding protein n=1 Tax=Gymnopus androsaceus JB14 TaxID=1447944 RepID=A0A6A4HU26_9AGAR|nr:NAD(P)-binding protein [Gymnopus androsaceus JB14]